QYQYEGGSRFGHRVKVIIPFTNLTQNGYNKKSPLRRRTLWYSDLDPLSEGIFSLPDGKVGHLSPCGDQVIGFNPGKPLKPQQHQPQFVTFRERHDRFASTRGNLVHGTMEVDHRDFPERS